MSKAKVMKAGRNPFSTTLGQFETGDAPQNYTNLTFFPSVQLDKLYIGSKIGDTDIAQMRLANEELFRKDPFYQAKLNLLNPFTSATKYIENKNLKEIQEELLKEKYRELKNRQRLLKGVPPNLQQPLLRVVEEAQIRPSSDTRAVLNDITEQLRASGDIDDRQARDLRHFAENALRTTLANREVEDTRIVSELRVARETVANTLRAQLPELPEDEIDNIAFIGVDGAIAQLRDLGAERGLRNLVEEGVRRGRQIAFERRRDFEGAELVPEAEERVTLEIGGEGRGSTGQRDLIQEVESRYYETGADDGFSEEQLNLTSGIIPQIRDDYSGVPFRSRARSTTLRRQSETPEIGLRRQSETPEISRRRTLTPLTIVEEVEQPLAPITRARGRRVERFGRAGAMTQAEERRMIEEEQIFQASLREGMFGTR